MSPVTLILVLIIVAPIAFWIRHVNKQSAREKNDGVKEDLVSSSSSKQQNQGAQQEKPISNINDREIQEQLLHEVRTTRIYTKIIKNILVFYFCITILGLLYSAYQLM